MIYMQDDDRMKLIDERGFELVFLLKEPHVNEGGKYVG